LFLAKQQQQQQQQQQQSSNNNQQSSLFSQPAYTTPSNTPKQQANDHKRRRQPSFKGDSLFGSFHQQRVQTAGRVGTKNFVNPCKVFFGNLPFNVNEDELQSWVCEQMGVPSHILIHNINIVRDWKSGDSKGYGFVQFTEAHYGTVAIDKCHNQVLCDRKLQVSQGQKKKEDIVYVKKTRKPALDAEEQAIQDALDEAEGLDDEATYMLRRLDPDLLPESLKLEMKNEEEQEEFAEDDGDMNRERRREAARKNKKKKKLGRGFGK
jgi:RNA recognition motif-containing protein